MKKCAIIGSKGYIGRHLEWYLKGMNIIPMCYDLVDEKTENYRQVDLTNKRSIAYIDLDVDYIFLTAGLTGTYVGFFNYEKYVTVNEVGLFNLLDAVRQSSYRPKLIFLSTRLVYKGADKLLKEDDEKETKSVYAVNKLACEGILQAYKASFDIPYIVFRICIPYGNLLGNDYSFGTVGLFVKMASEGKDISLYGGGSVKRTFTHMKDLCFQLVQGAFRDLSNGEIYNVGGETLSLKEAAEIVASKFGTKVVSVPWPKIDLRIESNHTYFDDNKIVKLLGSINYKKLKDFSNEI